MSEVKVEHGRENTSTSYNENRKRRADVTWRSYNLTRLRLASLGSVRHHSVPFGITRLRSASLGSVRHHSAPFGITRLRSASLGSVRPLLLLPHLALPAYHSGLLSVAEWTNSGLLEGWSGFKYGEYPFYRLVLVCVWFCKVSEDYGGSEPKSPDLTTRTLLTCTASTLHVTGTTQPTLRTTCCV